MSQNLCILWGDTNIATAIDFIGASPTRSNKSLVSGRSYQCTPGTPGSTTVSLTTLQNYCRTVDALATRLSGVFVCDYS